MEKQIFTEERIQNRLFALQDLKYREFQKSLIPSLDNLIGVRTPELRKLAKEIVKEGDWERFLAESSRAYYENDILQALVTATAKMDFGTRLAYVKEFVPRVNNWAVCDIFCSSLKDAKKHRETVWEFLQPYLKSGQEYEIRFGVVMLLSHFVEEAYLAKAFAAFDAITSEAYYVRMAVAWAVSVYFVHYPEETLAYLRENRLNDWIYNKTLQKILESYRVDAETKAVIRGMKR